VDGLKATLLRAIDAPADDLRRRMAAMREQLHDHDILAWARAYLSALDDSGRLTERLPPPPPRPTPTWAVPRPRTVARRRPLA
jgi:trehalose 6-phosphate synthase